MRFIKDFFIYGVLHAVSQLINFFLVPVYTHVFSTEQYGTIDLLSSIISLITVIAILQIPSAIARYFYATKETADKKNLISTGFSIILTLSALLVLFFLSASFFFKDLIEENLPYGIITAAILIVPFSALDEFFNIILRFREKAVLYALFNLMKTLIVLGVSILLVVVYQTGITGVFIGQLFGIAVSCFSMGYYLRHEWKVYFSREDAKKLLRYAAPLVPAVLAGWADANINRYVMVAYLSVAEIGIYAVALKVASVMLLFSSAINMAWGPYLFKTLQDPDHQKILRRVHLGVIASALTLVVILALSSDAIFKIAVPQEYFSGATLVGLLALAICLREIVFTLTCLGPAITKRTEYNLTITLSSVMINTMLLFVLVPAYGLVGVPVSLLIGNTVLAILSWYYSEKLYYIGFRKYPIAIGYFLTLALIILKYYIL